ncbi:MAG: transposase, partial [Aggregatilineales bacterium]
MGKKQGIHNEAFRREAVQLLETSGKSGSKLARKLGINEKSLYRWCGEYGTSVNTPAPPPQPDERDAEIKRLRRELEIIRHERDILKSYKHLQPRDAE